ncbi:MAG: lamin tail domain-containing protein [Pirellulales bacterium]
MPVGRERHPLRLESLEPRLALDARLLISELVASNELGLRDEDNDRPDWVEIFNAGDMAADLAGWYLTDDRDDLDKWSFPQVTLPPEEYLVVFASGKDRTDPSGPLHTNFRLRAQGEYLALVELDGSTVAFQYDFPRQETDVAFGLPQGTNATTLLGPESSARILIPTTDNGGATHWAMHGRKSTLTRPTGELALPTSGLTSLAH